MTGTPDPLVLPPDELARLRAVAAGGAREVRRAIAEAVNAERARADAAEAKLAEIHAYCRDECEVVNEGLRLVAIVRASDILAITGAGEENGHG